MGWMDQSSGPPISFGLAVLKQHNVPHLEIDLFFGKTLDMLPLLLVEVCGAPVLVPLFWLGWLWFLSKWSSAHVLLSTLPPVVHPVVTLCGPKTSHPSLGWDAVHWYMTQHWFVRSIMMCLWPCEVSECLCPGVKGTGAWGSSGGIWLAILFRWEWRRTTSDEALIFGD